MASSIYDYLIKDESNYNDWVLGGDSSEQVSSKLKYLIYAIIAFPRKNLDSLQSSIEGLVAKYIGENRNFELHAKDLWNGSSRKKTPFAVLTNKQAVKDFLYELCKVVSAFNPVIVANCWPYSQNTLSENKKNFSAKAAAAYSTLSRLDLNIHILSGKRIGNSIFFIDKECERMMMYHKNNPTELAGLLSEARVHKFENGLLELKFSINPRYIPIDSHQNLLVQIADLIAYFVGKHLVLREEIDAELNSTNEISAGLFEKIKDCNFAFHLWQLSDIEVLPFMKNKKSYPIGFPRH